MVPKLLESRIFFWEEFLKRRPLTPRYSMVYQLMHIYAMELKKICWISVRKSSFQYGSQRSQFSPIFDTEILKYTRNFDSQIFGFNPLTLLMNVTIISQNKLWITTKNLWFLKAFADEENKLFLSEWCSNIVVED